MRITLGPKEKKERRLGERLGLKGSRCAGPKCAAVRRSYPPGAHGISGSHRRLTGYGLQLREKQKVKLIYGLNEKQFSNYVKKATAKSGNTGLLLGRLLEQRLDNIVYRLGLARSRGEARQAVSHGHFLVNGKKVNVPSYQVRVGDIIEVKEKSNQGKYFQDCIKPYLENHQSPKWVVLEKGLLKGRVIAVPEEDDLPQNFDRSMIIGFYSR